MTRVLYKVFIHTHMASLLHVKDEGCSGYVISVARLAVVVGVSTIKTPNRPVLKTQTPCYRDTKPINLFSLFINDYIDDYYYYYKNLVAR